MQDFIISRFNSFSLNTKGISPENLLERSRKDFSYMPGSDILVVCLPSWGQNLRSWWRVKAHITNSGASFLTYQFPRQIFSNQAELTRNCFEVINQTVRQDIKELKEKYPFKKCLVVSLSIAGAFASMIYKDNPDIDEVVLVVPGENVAKDMWYGCRTRHLRRSYQKQGVTLEELEKAWYELSPENNLPALGTKMSIHLGRQDKVIPYRFSKTLPKTLEAKGFKIETYLYYFVGHYVVSLMLLFFPQFFIKLNSKRSTPK